MENQIKKLKKKKAAGKNEVKNEAWLYCTEEAKHRLLEIIQREERRLSKKLKERHDRPIYKEGDKDKATNYSIVS